MPRTATNGQTTDSMAKARAAKAAKKAAKAAARQSEPKAAEATPPPRIRLPLQYSTERVVSGVLDVQINTDPDMQNVTLIVKGPAPKMRALVRFAIEQSVPFLNDA